MKFDFYHFRTPSLGGSEVSYKEHYNQLVKAGADLSSTDFFGNTPLHLVRGETAISHLLYLGADPNVRNGWGSTPLHLAATRNE